MKKAMVNVPFDEEKLAAARLYMEQKDLSFEDEMSKAADALYGKYVPANVREFLEIKQPLSSRRNRKLFLLLLWALGPARTVMRLEKPELRY